MDVLQTAYLAAELAFDAWDRENPRKKINDHCRKVLFTVSQQTSIPVDVLLEDAMTDDIMYAKHLVRYALVRLMDYSPSAIQRMLGINRSSVNNSVNHIDINSKKSIRMQADLLAIESQFKA